MEFTSGFGPRFADSLTRALGTLSDDYRTRQKEQRQSKLLSQLLGGLGPAQQAVAPQGGGQPQAPTGSEAQTQPQRPSSAQILQMGTQLGIPYNQLKPIIDQYQHEERLTEQRTLADRKLEQQRNIAEEKPQRQKVVEAAESINAAGNEADDLITNYNNIEKLAKSGKLTTSKGRQFLEKIGIPDFFNSPADDVAKKIIEQTVNISARAAGKDGKLTNDRLARLAAQQPNLFQTTEGMIQTARLNILSAQQNKVLQDALKKERKKTGAYNIDAIDNAYANTQEERNKLEEQKLNIVDELIGNSETIASQSLQQPQEPRAINEDQLARRPSDESSIGGIGRILGGAVGSAAAGFAGVPGALASLADSIYQIGDPKRYIADPELRAQAAEREAPYVVEPFKAIQRILPTAESVKENASKYLPKDFLKPTNEAERFIYDVAEDIGTLMFPLGGSTTLLKSAAIAGGGNVGKYLTKYVGGSENAQQGAKIGTMLLTSFALQPMVKSKIDSYYNSLKESPVIESQIVTKNINNTIRDIEKTHSRIGSTSTPSKEYLNKVIDDVKKNVLPADKSIIRDVWAAKKDLSEHYAKAPKSAKPFIKKIQDSFNDTLKKNPEVPSFIKETLTEADQLNAGLHNSTKAQTFINNTFGSLPKKGLKYGLLHSPLKTILGSAATYTGVKGAAGLARAGGVIKELLTNTSFRKAYAEFANSALKESKVGVIKALSKMNKLVKNDQNL